MHFRINIKRAACGLLFIAALCVAAHAQKVPVVEKHLANGMRLLLVQRADEPNVAGGWVAHVGSANERPGITGIAHLFEHMMFKGTRTIGTTNLDQDLSIISSQEEYASRCVRRNAKCAQAIVGEIEDLFRPGTERTLPRARGRVQ
jgi:predicted Zn-dependent peptidase